MSALPKIAGLGVSLAAGVLFANLRTVPPSIVFLAVGQGDCAVYQDSGTTIMIDAGPKTEYLDAGARIIAPKLRKMGVGVIDLLVITHPDVDHIGGLESISKAVRIGAVAASAEFRNHKELADTLRAARINPDKIIWVEGGVGLSFGSTHGSFFAPKLEAGESDNEGSLFLSLRAEQSGVLLTGDAAESTEIEALGSQGNWRADILKAGHHGSAGSTSPSLLQAVSPSHIVVSCGRDNPYNHPSRELLSRLDLTKYALHRTDRDGDVRFEFRDGRAHRVR